MTYDRSGGKGEIGPDLPRVAWRTSSYSNNGGACVQVGRWTRSSYSNNGGDCIEVGGWTRSSYSNNGGDCVEATLFPHKAGAAELVVVRDSKDPDGPVLGFTGPEWTAFIAHIKEGGSGLT